MALRLEPYYLACSYCEHLVAVIQASLGVGAWMEDFVAISSEVVHLVLEQLEQLEQLKPKQEPYYQVPSFEKHLVGRMVELLEPLSVEEFYYVVVTILDYLVALMAHSLWSFQVLEQI